MDNRKVRTGNRKFKKRAKSFTEALKEKYCVEDEPTFDFIIVSPKRKNATEAELGHLRTVVLNGADINCADIPNTGLTSLCPNVVDLDLAYNLLENWSELLTILSNLPMVKYVNVSGNRLQLPQSEALPISNRLSVENLALNSTGSSIQEVVRLSHLMPGLKELHLCGNDYRDLGDIDRSIEDGFFSALECLRLNNNRFTDWSEVWKLRHLPHLKYLILSGNPIKNIFYNSCDGGDAAAAGCDGGDAAATGCDGKPQRESERMDTSEDVIQCGTNKQCRPGCDQQTQVEERDKHNGCDFDVADEDVKVMLEGSTSENDDVDDDNDCLGDMDENDDDERRMDRADLFDRPVSRFDHRNDPQVVSSDESSSDAEPSSWEETQVTEGISIPQATVGGSKSKKVYNKNFNNSGASRTDYSLGSVGDLQPGWGDHLIAMIAGPGADSDNEEVGEDDPGDWPRLAAEQFLYDLIDQLDLGEAPVTLSTASTSSSVSQHSTPFTSSTSTIDTSTTSALPQIALYNSSNLYTRRQAFAPTYGLDRQPHSGTINPASSSTFNNSYGSNINQNAATEEDYVSKMMAAITDDSTSSDTEENLFANIYSDDDFIPRSVTMLEDGAEGGSFFSPLPPWSWSAMRDNLNISMSSAKRRLFDSHPLPTEATTSALSTEVPGKSSAAVSSVPTSQSESDSCSDCEFEQHNLTAALRRELSETAQAANSTIRPVTGRDSWLETNKSFSTSVRDSVVMTTVPGCRVVVTGLSNTDIDTDPDNRESERGDAQQVNTKGMVNTSSQQSVSGMKQKDSQQSEPESSNIALKAAPSTTEPVPHQLDEVDEMRRVPFHQLQMLCLSNAGVCHSDHLQACTLFPMLTNIRLKNNPLYASVSNEDKRKLYIASLPNVTVLNGSEVTPTEREKAERFLLRFFMDIPDKPSFYDSLVAKHGPPVKLVDIDLGAGFQEYATLTFQCEGVPSFTRRLHLVEPVGRLRTLVAQVLGLPKRCFVLHHHPCGPSHPESEREIVELRCEALPMSRFDFAEGDEIIIDVRG